jgi:hypothetical protein
VGRRLATADASKPARPRRCSSRSSPKAPRLPVARSRSALRERGRAQHQHHHSQHPVHGRPPCTVRRAARAGSHSHRRVLQFFTFHQTGALPPSRWRTSGRPTGVSRPSPHLGVASASCKTVDLLRPRWCSPCSMRPARRGPCEPSSGS